jgi:CheY-like chemotaxis protein
MSKKILLIESDAPFAEELTSTLEARGLEVRTTADGREGYELAKEWGPDAVVLCVELPGMSGYVICQKLKKDEELKSIPLVITSAEATPETFEKHRTLKVRAEDYLLKPFTPTALLASLGALIELPEGGAEETYQEAPLAGLGLGEPEAAEGGDEEELVALEEEAGIEALGGEPLGGSDLPALDLGSLPDDGPAPASGPGLEDDLKLLDEAFEGLSSAGSSPAPAPKVAPAKPAARPAPAPARRPSAALDLDLGGMGSMGADELDAAAASLPEDDDSAARAALGRLDLVADEALDALGGDGPSPSLDTTEPESGADLGRDLLGGLDPDLGLSPEAAADEEPPVPVSTPVRGASTAALRAAGIKVVGESGQAAAATPAADTSRLERELSRKDQKIQDLEARLREAEDRAGEIERRADDAEQRAEAAETRTAEGASRLAAAESQATAAKSRLDVTLTQSRRLDADLKAAREESHRARERAEQAEAALDDERRRADEADARAATATEAQEKIDGLEREVDELKTELVVARGEAEGARSEVEKRTAELKKRVQDLEMAASKNEERVVKAYLKIKNDEKVREKTKKALAIASQLLDEGAPAEPAGAEKPRTAAQAAAAALGREQ